MGWLLEAKPLNILISYAYVSEGLIKELVEINNTHPDTLRVFLDSGAFSAFNLKKEIRIEDYCSFISSLPFKPWRYIALDVIGDEKKTKENYIEMLDRGFDPVPVFTYGADWKDVDFYYQRSDFVCMGGLVGERGSAKVVNDISKFIQIADGRKTHLLGYTNLEYIKKFRPFSCDSSSWLQCQRYGRLAVYMGNGRMKTIDRKELIKNPSEEIKAALRLMGIDIQLLKYKKYITGWRVKGEGSIAQRATTLSWVKLTTEMEKNIGTKMFLVCADKTNVLQIFNEYKQLENMEVI
tara:strand:+ start:337 stop:1218 length:882 start_codon:yes stop_codon:yes gene_type:complete